MRGCSRLGAINSSAFQGRGHPCLSAHSTGIEGRPSFHPAAPITQSFMAATEVRWRLLTEPPILRVLPLILNSDTATETLSFTARLLVAPAMRGVQL